jgi:hypothetical protein
MIKPIIAFIAILLSANVASGANLKTFNSPSIRDMVKSRYGGKLTKEALRVVIHHCSGLASASKAFSEINHQDSSKLHTEEEVARLYRFGKLNSEHLGQPYEVFKADFTNMSKLSSDIYLEELIYVGSQPASELEASALSDDMKVCSELQMKIIDWQLTQNTQ